MASTRKSKNKKQPGVPTSKYILGSTPVSNGTEYVIQKYKSGKKTSKVYLADVFDYTPPGFLYKDETGMGATTLELKAKRHSIIVEPIKITASSKAHAAGALYVGSQTKYHREKTVPANKIKAYVNNTSIDYKKIIVVADSLSRVIKAIGPNVFKDYFLLIDEIDSFQIDSTFRRSMEEVVEHYKSFDPEKRGLLSATRIQFSDPVLKNEPVTVVKYDKPYQREIKVLTTIFATLSGLAADYITELVQKHPKHKIFVAYNSVSGCLNLADHLVNNGVCTAQEVKILCSSASESRVTKYYHELDSEILPGKINFFTSAYFTGYDLKERYHLVSISDCSRPMHSLSDKRLKQIAGRCRPTLYSETVIHDFSPEDDDSNELTEEILIEAAQHQVEAISCTRRHYRQSPVLKMILGDFSKKMMAYLEEKTFKYIREDTTGNFVISYLNIDATLESNRVKQELYQSPSDLYTRLTEDGNFVKHALQPSTTKVEKSSSYLEHRHQEIDQIIERLKLVKAHYELDSILANEQLSNIQKQVVTDYRKLHRYVNPGKMLSMMQDYLKGRDSRKYNNLIQSAVLHVYPKGNIVVDRLNHHFPIQKSKGKVLAKEKLSADNIKLRMDMYLSELGISTPPKDSAAAVKMLRLYRDVSKRYDKKSGKSYFVITGKNPLKIPVKKTMPAVNAEDLFTSFFGY